MTKINLRADCARCAALCCMALAFDRCSQFAIDKPAGEACPHLDEAGSCTIHDERVECGFPGCVNFDCKGAGQRVTQAVFDGRSWMDDRSLVGPMSEAFSTLLRTHDCLVLLNQAQILDLSPPDRQTLLELRRAIEDAGIDTETIDTLQSRIDGFLSSLRGYVESREIRAPSAPRATGRALPPGSPPHRGGSS